MPVAFYIEKDQFGLKKPRVFPLEFGVSEPPVFSTFELGRQSSRSVRWLRCGCPNVDVPAAPPVPSLVWERVALLTDGATTSAPNL